MPFRQTPLPRHGRHSGSYFALRFTWTRASFGGVAGIPGRADNTETHREPPRCLTIYHQGREASTCAAQRLGYRFRLHRSDLPGTPDMVFPRLSKVVLVHGCFWHQHAGCRLARLPESRLDYWLPKLERNQQRDLQSSAALRAMGWTVLVIWECQVPDEVVAAARLLEPFLGAAA